ncbi:MAG: hypothetical protein MK103_09585 [Planctomycetes bacterium]|nr:hypothetical protein [Planctomycetota bacterium]
MNPFIASTNALLNSPVLWKQCSRFPLILCTLVVGLSSCAQQSTLLTHPGHTRDMPAHAVVTQTGISTASTHTSQSETIPYWITDEFISQGGDRNRRVVTDDQGMTFGLDTQDTVIQFHDSEGKQHSVGTNAVNIYAPRFGASLDISQPHQFQTSNAGSAVHTADQLHQADQFNRLHVQQHLSAPELALSDLRALGITGDQATGNLANADRLETSTGMMQPGITSGNQNGFLIEHSTNSREDLVLSGPQSWTSDQSAQAILTPSSGNEVIGQRGAQSIERVQYPTPSAGAIQAHKTASSQEARSGEVIEFVIHYKNVGGRALNQVVITDNLTTRLEYFPKSQRNSLDSNFSRIENSEGSSILRWTLRSALKPNADGTITFRATVR